MAWTYYKQTYPNGFWVLFRHSDEDVYQVYHRLRGWRDDDELFYRIRKGEVDSNDVVAEDEARQLVHSLREVPPW